VNIYALSLEEKHGLQIVCNLGQKIRTHVWQW